MRPIRGMPAAVARGLRGVFTDIDGTLTDGAGRIPATAFAAMEALAGAGLRVVVVTGRPAGWCDLIARTWPADAVVGENGGLCFWREGEGMERRYASGPEVRARDRARLDAISREVLAAIPGTALASDQPYRLFDLAVDYCEDVPPVPKERVLEIVRVFERHGATAKVSNIHVNGWFGTHDKLSMCRELLRHRWGLDPDEEVARWTFFGDSPNDEPMFAAFPHAIGVANIRRFAAALRHPPAWVTIRDGADGFREGVSKLLALRSTRPGRVSPGR